MASIKGLPNWRGIHGIRFNFGGEWADSQLLYHRYIFNAEDIEDALWKMFCEETGHKDNEFDLSKVQEEFNMWLNEDKRAKNYLDDCIHGRCYIGRYH